MKKNLIFLLLTFSVLATAMGQTVNKNEAYTAALNFLSHKQGSNDIVLTDRSAELPDGILYIFETNKGSGFVIVAGDRRMTPILGYSTSGRLGDTIPNTVKNWLEKYSRQAAFVRKTKSTACKEISEQWEVLLAGGDMANAVKSTPVEPLLHTQWAQSPWYNQRCPFDNSANERALTGCVATSMAQVMKYWGHPTLGEGSHTYSHNTYGLLTANFGDTAYLWDSMPNKLNSSSSQNEVDAVSRLVFHCGVALNMNYGPHVSIAYNNTDGLMEHQSIEQVMVEHFKYDMGIRCVELDYYGIPAWYDLLDSELYNARPVIYDGQGNGGHSFVCDGKDSRGLYHFNWGWGGYCDGYFAISGLAANEYDVYKYNQTALIGVMPRQETDSSNFLIEASASDTLRGYITGAQQYSRGERVNLVANAQPGYRFKQWSDGNIYNPRCFLAYGDMNLVAEFVSVWDNDTLVRDHNSNRDPWGWGWGTETNYWGVKYRPILLSNKDSITSVNIYILASGSYRMRLKWGNSTRPLREFYNQAFDVDTTTLNNHEGSFWHNIALDQPIALKHDSTLWVLFECRGAYHPAAYTYYYGEKDACYASSNGSLWKNQTDYGIRCHTSWKIRPTFIQKDTPVAINPVRENTLTLFPNPATESVAIDGLTPTRVWLYDMKGVRHELSLVGNKIMLNNLPKGIYILQAYGNGRTTTTRLIKK